jgi:hypothetical protein
MPHRKYGKRWDCTHGLIQDKAYGIVWDFLGSGI